jgi:uncharacterized protein YegL
MAGALYLAAPRREARLAGALRDRLTAQNLPVQLWIAEDDAQIARAVATHDYYSAVFSSDMAAAEVASAARSNNRGAVIEREAVVASSPIVIGWSRQAAARLGRENLGWQALIAQSERPDFRIMHASGADPAGRWTLAVLAKATGDVGDANGDLLRRIESRTAGYAADDFDIGNLLRGQPVDAFVAQEQAALSACSATEGRYVLALPEEGTFLVRRPLLVARVEGYVNEERLAEEIALFDRYEPFLSSPSWSSTVGDLGYRGPDGLAAPAAAAPHYAASPAFPSYWEAPTPAGMAQFSTLWADVKRPASILLLLDTSSSMDGEKLDAARQAIRRFLPRIAGTSDRLGLMTFGSSIEDAVLLQLAGTATAEIEASLDWATAAGGTPLFDCVAAAIERLAADGRTDLRAIVLLSDGEDTTSTMSLGEVTPGIRAAEHLLIYAVSYPEGDPDTLASLVAEGRGQVRESDPESVAQLYETISRRL